jgi:phosphoserine phosphatase
MLTIVMDLDGCSVRHPATGADVIQTADGPDFSVWQVRACTITPRRPVSTLWRFALRAGLRVVVITSRGEAIATATREACEAHGLRAHGWHFRAAGDRRPAAEHKADALRAVRAAGLRPVVAVDDEAANVAMFRAAGLRAVRVRRAKPTR